MNYYAVVDSNGVPTAFYNDDLYPLQVDGTRNAAIPATAFAISKDIWQECISNNGLRTLSVDANGVVTIGTITPPPPAPEIPQIISDRQFFQQLALTPDPSKSDGSTIISQSDALAAVCTGTIPPAMEPLIASLPASEQFAARIKIAGATQFDLADLDTQALRQANGWSEEQLDQFWLAASQL